MKALTLRLPWAVLVVTGRKRLESRRGPVLNRYTGPLAIHVSKRSPGWEDELARLTQLFRLDPDDMANPFGLATDALGGHLIGTVTAGRTIRITPLFPGGGGMLNAAVFDDLRDRYLTDLTDPGWLADPVPARGSLGLWKTDTPIAEQAAP